MLVSLVAGCASIPNQPLNKPVAESLAAMAANTTVDQPRLGPKRRELADDSELAEDPLFVGITFSGGGTRAAALGYGVLKELEATEVRVLGRPSSLFNHIDILSGVSGGSVLAAYVGLRGRDGLADFRERFLIRNAEENLNLRVGLSTLGGALGGGINDQTRLPRWLDDHLFNGATLHDLEHTRPKHVYIYASDLYNRNSFVFSRETFDAICSDYDSYPLSYAVAASAAVPIVFSPIVLEAFPDSCKNQLPPWVDRANKNREESEILRSAAQGLLRNRDREQVRYVKLVDGGLSDNFGITGFIVQRAKEHTPYAPLSAEHAVKFKRALFLVVNAGTFPSAPWARTLEGPGGLDMVDAMSDTAIRSNVRANFDTFRDTFRDWREELVRWRCSLPPEQVAALRGTPTGWNCRDVQFFIGEIGFDQLGPDRLKALSTVPTRFVLPEDQVDAVIAAGRDALRSSDVFRRFLASLGSTASSAQHDEGDTGRRVSSSGCRRKKDVDAATTIPLRFHFRTAGDISGTRLRFGPRGDQGA
jgi:NTE family protein